SAHPLNGPPNDRQPNSGALVRALWMKALKDSEDAFMSASIDADAFVFKPEADPFVEFFGSNADARKSARFDEFDRVIQQIGNHLCQRRGIGLHRRQGTDDL